MFEGEVGVCLLRLAALAFSFCRGHTQGAHTQRVRKEGTMLSSLPPSSKDVFFSPLSPRLPGRGTLVFVSKGTRSLSSSLLFSLSFSFTPHKERGRGCGEVFHLHKEGHRETSATKEHTTRERREKKDKIMRQKREMRPHFVFPCFVLFPLTAV